MAEQQTEENWVLFDRSIKINGNHAMRREYNTGIYCMNLFFALFSIIFLLNICSSLMKNSKRRGRHAHTNSKILQEIV